MRAKIARKDRKNLDATRLRRVSGRATARAYPTSLNLIPKETTSPEACDLPLYVPTRVGETLFDVTPSTGTRRPWGQHKGKSQEVAASYIRIGKRTGDASFEKAGSRMWVCGDEVGFADEVDHETGELVRRLEDAHFCRDMLCPVCAWRKSRYTFSSLMRCMGWVDEHRGKTVPIFLTLTQKNCSAEELYQAVRDMLKSFTRLMGYARVSRAVVGYFRNLEVTINDENGTFHPHIHAILLVRPNYFAKSLSLYIDQKEWVELWKRAAGIPDGDASIVDVRRLRSSQGRAKAVAEAAKYTVKPGDLVCDDYDETDRRVETVRRALLGLRKCSYGGVLKEARAALKIADADDERADLVHAGDEGKGKATRVAFEVYRWSSGLHDYVCVSMVAEQGTAVMPREGPGRGAGGMPRAVA